MSATQEMKWYAVRSISGKESKTKHYIETEMSRMGMSNLLGQVLIPTEKVYHRVKMFSTSMKLKFSEISFQKKSSFGIF